MSEVPDYPQRDLRRMLVVLAAIDIIDEATLVKIARYTGIDKKTVINLIEKARTQVGVVIEKADSVYVIKSWVKWTHQSRHSAGEFKLCPFPPQQLPGAAP